MRENHRVMEVVFATRQGVAYHRDTSCYTLAHMPEYRLRRMDTEEIDRKNIDVHPCAHCLGDVAHMLVNGPPAPRPK